MRYLFIALLLAVAIPALAQDAPPAPIQAEDGVATFGWANDIGADLVIVTLNRSDCILRYDVDPTEVQQIIQVPRPTDDARCRLRLADQITLLRYRNTVFIDALGPYVQRGRVLLPLLIRE